MKKVFFTLSLLTVILSSCGNSASVSCSSDELQKKMLLVQATMGEYLQKHPEKASEIQSKFQNVQKEAALAEGPLNSCKMYDDILSIIQ